MDFEFRTPCGGLGVIKHLIHQIKGTIHMKITSTVTINLSQEEIHEALIQYITANTELCLDDAELNFGNTLPDDLRIVCKTAGQAKTKTEATPVSDQPEVVATTTPDQTEKTKDGISTDSQSAQPTQKPLHDIFGRPIADRPKPMVASSTQTLRDELKASSINTDATSPSTDNSTRRNPYSVFA